jgi:hypothetical protein
MKKTTVITLILWGLAAVATAGQIAFVDTYDKALQVAGQQSKNIVITFYADW